MSAIKQMTASKKELLDLEKGFWTGDAAYYAANADAECLVAFPEMAQAIRQRRSRQDRKQAKPLARSRHRRSRA